MTTNTQSALLKEDQGVQKRLNYLEKERSFLKSLYSDLPETMQLLAKGAPLGSMLGRFKTKIEDQLASTYCLFLVCDKDCLQWRLQYPDSINEKLLNGIGQLTEIPQSLVTFAASPSCPKRMDSDIQQSTGWSIWQTFLEHNGFIHVSMVSVSDEKGSIYLMLSFQKENSKLESELMDVTLDMYLSLVSAAFERERANFLLLEDSHKSPDTGLLRRYSFENSFGIILKDSRRHFQRAALMSIRLLDEQKINSAELKALADVMRESVRDNDLIAHYDERELVMGIRIQHLVDAEVVANKLLDSLQKDEFSNNRLIRSGIAIGIAFYPEHSSLDALHQAAAHAASSLKKTTGYHIEFHGKFHKSSSDLYS
ncbi:GGDEF domain-containing protein [Marinomonas sp. C2222]|uniref:GGDEF domain-containing protein n=1 Tax=Marinomonas sargassi TaxID=2984494 RepID=A0ABT2YPG6_9GAMM|nr:GGDEF domain-containing protein [Marinomonas sargassi]MCV2401779.1 GGDEF domain-containing protein [Marinomonas sargassi]